MNIISNNLTIRNATAADAEQLCRWWNDGKIMAQFGAPNGLGCKPEKIREGLISNADDNRHIIELDGKPIGEMNYRNFCYPNGVIELDGEPIDDMTYRSMEGAAEPGIKICEFSERDKGYGTQLLTVFIDALFRYYGYKRIIIDTDLKNERAQHVYEKKLGFRRLGIHKDSSRKTSDFYESVVYFEMSKTDWLERFPAVEYRMEECTMSGSNSTDVFAKIEEETQKYLNGDNLKVAMDLLTYLKESGRTWLLSEHHPEFYYMGEMTCLIAYDKGGFDLNDFREIIESAGNRFVYDPSSNWNICCWQHKDDIYELDSFPVDDDVKEYARENVWKCVRCHADGSCGTLGGSHRTVFGKTFDNACCNVFQLANPTEKELGYIIELMELEKHIIAERKNK